jgi:hypothetical protein
MNQLHCDSPPLRQIVQAWVQDAAGQNGASAFLGKRSAERYVWPAAIEVLVDRGRRTERRTYFTGHDVSESGMGLFGRHKLTVGASILLRYADEGDACPWVPARVEHSTRSVGGYRVGIRFLLGDDQQSN